MDTDQHLIDQFFSDHSDIAIQYIEELDIEEIAQLLETLADNQCKTILSRVVAYKTGKVMEKISVERAGVLIELLNTLVSQSILRVTDRSVRDEILKEISNEKATYLRRALEYPKDQVGAHIEPFVLTLSTSIKIERGLSLINENKAIIKPHIFTLDEEGKLVGYVELNNLIVADPSDPIQSISKIVRNPAFANMTVADLLEQWDNAFIDLPVINTNGVFLGTVSRTSLSEFEGGKTKIDNTAIKAGNALGDLYLVGLTSLLGSPANPESKNLNR